MDKKIIIAAIAIITVIIAGLGYVNYNSAEFGPHVQITDLSGRNVSVPANVTHVAALVGPSFEKLILLNQTSKISIMMPVSNGSSPGEDVLPWAYKVAPELQNISSTASYKDPNIEELLNKKVQVVFFWDFKDPVAKMTASNIPVVVTQISSGNPSSAEDFVKFEKQEVELYGQVMGPDAKNIADDWCAYFDKKVNYVTSRTANLTDSQRPKVYYCRGPDALTTQGKNSYTQWYVEMAGGDYIAKNTDKEGRQTITMEQIVAWNPDVIYIGRGTNSTDLIMKDPKWNSIKAVQDNNVHVCPQGVFYWDYGSEGVLLMEYFAKTLHPELFKDLNMTNEVKEYYTKFYHYNLTDEEANKILQHLPPAS